MVRMDEVETADLVGCRWEDVREELGRVLGVIDGLVMTGAGLLYWYERERVLRALLGREEQ